MDTSIYHLPLIMQPYAWDQGVCFNSQLMGHNYISLVNVYPFLLKWKSIGLFMNVTDIWQYWTDAPYGFHIDVTWTRNLSAMLKLFTQSLWKTNYRPSSLHSSEGNNRKFVRLLAQSSTSLRPARLDSIYASLSQVKFQIFKVKFQVKSSVFVGKSQVTDRDWQRYRGKVGGGGGRCLMNFARLYCFFSWCFIN